MESEYIGGIDGQGAVDINVNPRQPFFIVEIIQGIDDFLGPPDAEGRDDEFPPFIDAGIDEDIQEFGLGTGPVLMQPVSVGRLGDQVIGLREGVRDDAGSGWWDGRYRPYMPA